jgi:urea carboxylase-associated protein 2
MSRDGPACLFEKGQTMILTKEQQAEVAANRKRYEELKAAGQGHVPRALPPPTSRDGAAIAASAIIHREIVPGGWYWTTRLHRGEALRLANTEGTSSVSLLAWNAADTSERLNHADTIKVQWAASLRKGRVILSDMGRVLFSIVEDVTGGAHDALAGGSTAATNEARYHATTFRNTRDNFILAAGKLGLDRRDVHPCIGFFAPVSVDADGRFQWDNDRRLAGDFIDLRAEMDVLVALSNCPHPLDPSPAYMPGRVEIVRYGAGPIRDDDLCRSASAEAVRAFENNALLFNSGVEA